MEILQIWINNLGEEMTNEDRITGEKLNKEWGVGAAHPLYKREGNWYHLLERFPGALFDFHGYILFPTQEDYENCDALTISEHIHVGGNGISSIPGYRKMRD
jgi:hypothetical protein